MQPTLETNEKTAVLPIACYPWGRNVPPCWPRPSAAWTANPCTCFHGARRITRDKPRYLHDNEPVYTDSCLEAFLACYPQRSEEYVNFEVNRAGAMLMQRGTGRADRVFSHRVGFSRRTVFREGGKPSSMKRAGECGYARPCAFCRRSMERTVAGISRPCGGNFSTSAAKYLTGSITPCWPPRCCSLPVAVQNYA